MPQLRDASTKSEGVLLAVYAPLGTDETLSNYPGDTASVLDHPLVDALRRVAKAGTHVMALVDRVGDDTYLLDIPVQDPDTVHVQSRWKQDMCADRTLTGFLLEAHERYPQAAMVLGLEGHGAGYLPELDTRRLGASDVSQGQQWVWQVSGTEAAPYHGGGDSSEAFPALPVGFPGCPAGIPGTPVNHLPISTYALGRALRRAQEQGCPRISVIHFGNCFNMSTEVLHTVAPYADAADGFCNYGYFTAGAAYAEAFQKLADAGAATSLELAHWLSKATHDVLAPSGGYPAVGGVVALARMKEIANGIDRLSDRLLDLLRGSTGAAREAAVLMIQGAISDAQQYDTDAPLELETPDQLTDICSLAATLARDAGDYPGVVEAASALVALLKGIKSYGTSGVPAMDPSHSVWWDFSEPTLAMNIFLPDPLRTGQWDWRSSYYADVNPQPFAVQQPDGSTRLLPPAQTGVIDFLKETNWVEFLKEYHRDTAFRAFHVGRIPKLPGFDPQYVAPVVKPAAERRPRRPRPLGRIGQAVAARQQGGEG